MFFVEVSLTFLLAVDIKFLHYFERNSVTPSDDIGRVYMLMQQKHEKHI